MAMAHRAAIVVEYLTPLSAANTSFAGSWCVADPHKLAGKLAIGLYITARFHSSSRPCF